MLYELPLKGHLFWEGTQMVFKLLQIVSPVYFPLKLRRSDFLRRQNKLEQSQFYQNAFSLKLTHSFSMIKTFARESIWSIRVKLFLVGPFRVCSTWTEFNVDWSHGTFVAALLTGLLISCTHYQVESNYFCVEHVITSEKAARFIRIYRELRSLQ